MIDLSTFYNSKFKLLEYLWHEEINENNEAVIKKSQDEMANELGYSKHTINDKIKELKEEGFLTYDKGKYKITDLGYKSIGAMCKGKHELKASKYQCISLFAGVGGIDYGFEHAGFKTVYANEFDPKAVHTYELNHDIKVDCRDIHEVVKDLEEGKDPFNNQDFNILLAGFPCQAFSIAGYREGFEDKKGRGGLFFEIVKIIHYKKPEIVFLENVKNLRGHDNGKTFSIIIEALEAEGYHVKHEVLNSMDYGNVPQNRERIYIVAFRDKAKCDKFQMPTPIKLEKGLDQIIDYHTKLDDKFYYTDKFLHYDELLESINRKDTLYQWRRRYVRENKSNVCPTLTANMGTGGHNVPLVLTDHGIRKLTPKECFGFQGFPQKFTLPDDLSNSYLYKQAGNSVSVSVIERIAKQILKVL